MPASLDEMPEVKFPPHAEAKTRTEAMEKRTLMTL
jgi:hypothetical protein